MIFTLIHYTEKNHFATGQMRSAKRYRKYNRDKPIQWIVAGVRPKRPLVRFALQFFLAVNYVVGIILK